MNINDIVTDWLWDKNELQKYQLDFCQYFKKAILSTQNKNRTYFGTKKDEDEDRLERLKKADTIPDKIYSRTTYFKRNPDVVVEVLLRANGICERCNKPAPFMRISDNTPYLEVHHLEPLAVGGGDTTENAIALCPNCHRELHFGF